jgi:hypothetical protein
MAIAMPALKAVALVRDPIAATLSMIQAFVPSDCWEVLRCIRCWCKLGFLARNCTTSSLPSGSGIKSAWHRVNEASVMHDIGAIDSASARTDHFGGREADFVHLFYLSMHPVVTVLYTDNNTVPLYHCM